MESEHVVNVEKEYYQGSDGDNDNERSHQDNDNEGDDDDHDVDDDIDNDYKGKDNDENGDEYEEEILHPLVEVEADEDICSSDESNSPKGSVESYNAELTVDKSNIQGATQNPCTAWIAANGMMGELNLSRECGKFSHMWREGAL